VTVDEIVTMVNIALDVLDVVDCLMGDANGDGEITIEEIITAVFNALNDCPAPPPTPTATATATVGPVTDVAERASSAAVILARSLPSIPAMLSSLTQLAGGGGGGNGSGGVETPCSGGGTRDLTCTQTIPTSPPRNYSLAFGGCVLPAAGGGTVSLQGTANGQSTQSGVLAICSVPPLSLSSFTTDGLMVTARNAQSMITLSAGFDISGSVAVTPDLVSNCRVAALDLILSGAATVETPARNVRLDLNSTQIRIEVQQFSSACVPVRYRMTLNGAARFTDQTSGQVFEGGFSNFVLTSDTTGANELISLAGTVSSPCLGGAVTYSTAANLEFVSAAACPIAGTMLAVAGPATDRIVYTAGGGVQIDLGNNGSIDEAHPGCLDLSPCTSAP
jgi:hypothetical protein